MSDEAVEKSLRAVIKAVADHVPDGSKVRAVATALLETASELEKLYGKAKPGSGAAN